MNREAMQEAFNKGQRAYHQNIPPLFCPYRPQKKPDLYEMWCFARQQEGAAVAALRKQRERTP